MDLIEKNIYLHYKDDEVLTMGVDTFLYFIFDTIKNEIINLGSIDYINEFLNSIKKVIELNNDKDYISLELENDKNLLFLFSYGLGNLSKELCEYYDI